MTHDRPMPQSAGWAWWQAWPDKDVERLEAMALEEYLEFAGQGHKRTEGKHQLLVVAQRFLAIATIDDSSVSDFRFRETGTVAACSYRWAGHGTRDGEPFDLQGMALDVLSFHAGGWKYQAHHVSMVPE